MNISTKLDLIVQYLCYASVELWFAIRFSKARREEGVWHNLTCFDKKAEKFLIDNRRALVMEAVWAASKALALIRA